MNSGKLSSAVPPLPWISNQANQPPKVSVFMLIRSLGKLQIYYCIYYASLFYFSFIQPDTHILDSVELEKIFFYI